MAHPTIHIEYHQGLEPLEKLLTSVQRPGGFCVHGTLELALPKVEIDGVGVLSFPFPAAQAQSLIAQASRAPYGRGEETILDTTVRKVWQIPPERVALSGKAWPITFECILAKACDGLGCNRAIVSAELYKLLIYDEGSFFAAHRDTEKADGMFGTLVISLPSIHKGGELVLRHAGREVTVDTSSAEVSELSFAAFYADCEHEVRPVIEGNRICLVYNLIQSSSAKGSQEQLTAPLYAAETASAAVLIREALHHPDAPAKLAWLLEHQYSPAGLSFSGLKNRDAAVAKVLWQAAMQAGCDVHLAMVHIEQSGSAQMGYASDYRARRDWRRREAQDVDSDAYAVIEVIDSSEYVDEWVDLKDQRVSLGRIPLENGEILPRGSLDDEEPDEQRVMEATGNEGASFERSYHRATLVFWRQDRRGDVLLQGGVRAAFPHLNDCIDRMTASRSSSGREEALAFALRVLSAWEGRLSGYSCRKPADRPARGEMLGALERLGDTGLIERFILSVVANELDGSENEALTTVAQLLGAARSAGVFTELVARQTPSAARPCVGLLSRLVEVQSASRDPAWLEALRSIARALVAGLEKIGDPATISPYERWIQRKEENFVDGQSVADLLASLQGLAASELEDAAVAIACARPAVFDPNTVVAPAIALCIEQKGMRIELGSPCQRLWKHAAEFLLQRSETPPDPPRDWRQEVKLSCQCEDCKALAAFAIDPVSQAHRFSVRQSRRSHLEHVLKTEGLDMSHVTETRGSPQTLICTKTRRSHERRCEQHKVDITSLRRLAQLAEAANTAKSDDLLALTARIAAAVDRVSV